MENQAPQMVNEPTKKMSPLTIVLIIAVAILVIGNGVMAYLFLTKYESSESPKDSADQVVNEITDDTTTAESSDVVEGEDLDDTEIQDAIDEYNANSTKLEVTWANKTALKTLTPTTAFGSVTKYFTTKDSGYNLYKELKVFKAGTIKSGKYQGAALYLVTYSEMGTSTYSVIKTADKNIVLAKYSDEMLDYFKGMFEIDEEVTLIGLETPDVIKIPDSLVKYVKANFKPSFGSNVFTEVYASEPDYVKVFKYDGDNYLYRDTSDNCYFAVANDGTMRFYNFDVLNIKESNSATLPVTWQDGSTSKDYYVGEFTGCGSTCYNYVEGITLSDLTKTGELKGGYPIYELKAGVKTRILEGVYNSLFPPDDGNTDHISFEAFVNKHPLPYWQDPFGKFIQMQSKEFVPMAECGKPVIYLYPEQDMDVKVKVAPNGGFSITEPMYNGGWFVKATPNSELFNYADSTVYPYLFWEGKGMFYEMPKQGFVVAKENVEKFLWEKLALLGLNEKESAEFMEFWYPKMQDRNYYYVTFMPQQDFNQLAPLQVSPRPDTIIRVFMDFRGIDKPISVVEPKIVTPERIGFTVVEWGGALN